MKSKVFNRKSLVVFAIAFFAIVIYSQINGKDEKFSQAKDFPKGALVYVQFADLPKLFEIWDKSKLKDDYLKSVNYNEFQKRHLALKIVERWAEFNSAFALPFEFETLNSLSETKVALAIYDIGKLDFVFIAPMSKEKILASYFFQNKTGFEENNLEDGNVFYSKEIDVDRGRQKQKLFFMKNRGRLIFATNEAIFFRTLANLKDTSKNENLANEFEFKSLAEKAKTHLATVWLNQTKLNNDWYFKHYWLMNNFEDLKNIRTGMFDFELQEDKLIEHRIFFKSDGSKVEKSKLSAKEISSLQKFIPENTPFYKIETVGKTDQVRRLLRQTLLDNYSIPSNPKNRSNDYYFYDNSYTYDSDYSYLGENFDLQINDAEDAEINDNLNVTNSLQRQIETNLLTKFQGILNQTNPSGLVYLLNPQKLENPLFLKAEKAIIFSIQNKGSLKRNSLETIISKLLQNHLTIASSSAKFEWQTIEKDGFFWREIVTPFLDWKFFYTVHNNEIIFANDESFLLNILVNEGKNPEANEVESLNELTVINLNQREKVFDDVMKRLIGRQAYSNNETDFFVNNVGSLLDVLSVVESFEIKRFDEGRFSKEQIVYKLRRIE